MVRTGWRGLLMGIAAELHNWAHCAQWYLNDIIECDYWGEKGGRGILQQIVTYFPFSFPITVLSFPCPNNEGMFWEGVISSPQSAIDPALMESCLPYRKSLSPWSQPTRRRMTRHLCSASHWTDAVITMTWKTNTQSILIQELVIIFNNTRIQGKRD